VKKRSLTLLLNILALLVFCGGCGEGPEDSKIADVEIASADLKMFQPLPQVMPSNSNRITEEKVALGRMLYYEPRLSKDQKISCNSCHMLDKFGVDGQATSDGYKGQKGNRNAPTVYNAAGHFVQFWDGRAADVEEQAKGPVMNPVEMAMPSEKQVNAVLKSMPEYVQAFEKAFPGEKDPVNYENMVRAIGAFERKLITPSRWDKFLRGDSRALNNDEKTGFLDFLQAGCQACHSGAYLGGNVYQKLGLVKPWSDTSDVGREKITKNEADRMVFKVPGLRNIAQTMPYYHDGKVATLEQAVSKMAEYQLGKKLTNWEVRSIIRWLKTLTGDLPAEYIREPVLPKSTAATPKPEI
jgi:cytochrome c peroxidase